MKISVCIIAKNNQDVIADCLESVGWASEIIVVDTGSTDLTNEIAKQYGARIISYPKGSYDSWRNRGLKSAKCDWLLYVDTDERIPESLKKEIELTVTSTRYSAFAIPRKNIIFGKEFKFGGQYPDYQIRLFKRNKLKKWQSKVHEQPVFDGELGYLKNSISHYKHNNIHDMVSKTNKWSEIEANLMFEANHPQMNIVRFMSAMAREFWKRFIKEQGFRDGPEGIIYSGYQIFSKFVSYAKLWEMQEKSVSLKNQKK